MAISGGNIAYWSEVKGIYDRAGSERSRWGRGTTVTGSSAGATINFGQGFSWRNALVDLTANVSFLNGFFSTVAGTANISSGSSLSAGTPSTLRNVLNNMRSVFGYSGNVGVSYGTYGTGFSANRTHCDYAHNDNSVFGFTSGGDFGHSADYGFRNGTIYDTNNYCAFCASGFFPGCSPFCTGGFCTSGYFSAAI